MAEPKPVTPFVPRNLRAALEYIKRGFLVFPVSGKIPATKHGFKDATRDPAVATGWWSANGDHGIAIPTGAENGLLVLDVDPRNAGDESLAALIREHGPLSETPVQRTGGGGLHYFFAHPGGTIPCAHPWPGLDIKGDGGYVVVPFSRHPSGATYEWERGKALGAIPLAPPPDWLLSAPKPDVRATIDALDSTIEYPFTTRNASLISDAGVMQRRGMDPDAILAALLVHNQNRCKPPLAESEVREIADSITRYKPSVAPGATVISEWERRSLEKVSDPSAGAPSYLIEDLLPKGDLTLMAASWKSGKTLLAYRLAIDAARGVPFLGQFDIEKPIRTAILQQEMPFPEDIRRFRRLGLGAGLKLDEIIELGRTNLFHFNRLPMFLSDTRDVARLHSMILDQGIELVLVDSLLANFAGTNLNDNSESRLAFSLAFNPLTSKGVTVLLLHHYKKVQNGDNALDQRSLVLGAQAWAAAAGRIYALEPVAMEGAEEGTFRVRLSSLGSWTPGGGATLIEVRDEGEGTAVEVVESHEAATFSARVMHSLITLVRERRAIKRKEAFALLSLSLRPAKLSLRTFERSVTRAVAQGAVESVLTKTVPCESVLREKD